MGRRQVAGERRSSCRSRQRQWAAGPRGGAAAGRQWAGCGARGGSRRCSAAAAACVVVRAPGLEACSRGWQAASVVRGGWAVGGCLPCVLLLVPVLLFGCRMCCGPPPKAHHPAPARRHGSAHWHSPRPRPPLPPCSCRLLAHTPAGPGAHPTAAAAAGHLHTCIVHALVHPLPAGLRAALAGPPLVPPHFTTPLHPTPCPAARGL